MVHLRRAERIAREALNGAEPATLPHITASRDAYRAFGAKAQGAETLVRGLRDLGRPAGLLSWTLSRAQ
jgi:hypothetical protein